MNTHEKHDYKRDSYPLVVFQKLVREEQQRHDKQHCRAKQRADILNKEAHRYLRQRRVLLLIIGQAGGKHEHLPRNVLSEDRVEVARDGFLVLYRTAVKLCNVVPQRRQGYFIQEIEQHGEYEYPHINVHYLVGEFIPVLPEVPRQEYHDKHAEQNFQRFQYLFLIRLFHCFLPVRSSAARE